MEKRITITPVRWHLQLRNPRVSQFPRGLHCERVHPLLPVVGPAGPGPPAGAIVLTPNTNATEPAAAVTIPKAPGGIGFDEFSCGATKVWSTEPPAGNHDLAVLRMEAPKNINLQGAEPSLTKSVKVTLQNRSPHDEVITNFNGLVTLVAESLSNVCPNATVVLHQGPPNNPKTLKPKQKMTATFDVTYNCANDSLKGAGHEDFRYLASVHHEAIDRNPDTHPADDN